MVWKGSQGFQAGQAATGLSTSAVGSQSTGGSTWTPRRGGAHNSGSTHTQTVAPPRSRAAYSTLTTEGGGDLLPGIHGALTIAGAIPVIGMPADIIDATICGFEGDWTCVGFSAIGLIPIAGDIAGTALKLGRAGTNIAESAAAHSDDLVDLVSANRRTHILDGEVRPNGSYGGGHRPGTGFPGKSEFPQDWSDEQIIHSISDVATDPSLAWVAGRRDGDYFANGTRGGIEIQVLIRDGQIWTGYPVSSPRNTK